MILWYDVVLVRKISIYSNYLKYNIVMPPEFSICIPVLNDRYIRKCLDSIFASKFQDFEVIVNDASDQFYVTDQISDYDVKIIKKRTKSFESRLISVKDASGDRVLIFDDTRLVPDTLLGRLSDMPEDMIVVAERDIGNGILARLSNLDKRALSKERVKLNPLENKSVIPRIYRRNILMRAFEAINRNLSPSIISNMVGLDLEILYYEAFKISQSIRVLQNPEIMHYGDETLKSILNKYYRYGYTQRMLKGTIYSELASLSGRNRSSYAVSDRILSLPLQVIRGVPFILGYISGNDTDIGDTFNK